MAQARRVPITWLEGKVTLLAVRGVPVPLPLPPRGEWGRQMYVELQAAVEDVADSDVGRQVGMAPPCDADVPVDLFIQAPYNDTAYPITVRTYVNQPCTFIEL